MGRTRKHYGYNKKTFVPIIALDVTALTADPTDWNAGHGDPTDV
jgi:hypothetical protein